MGQQQPELQLDFELTPASIPFLSKIQWGVRYGNRDAPDVFAQRYWSNFPTFVPLSSVPLSYILYPGGFRGDDHAPVPINWLGPTFDSVWADLTRLRQFNMGFGGTDYGSNDLNDPAADPTARRTDPGARPGDH